MLAHEMARVWEGLGGELAARGLSRDLLLPSALTAHRPLAPCPLARALTAAGGKQRLCRPFDLSPRPSPNPPNPPNLP